MSGAINSMSGAINSVFSHTLPLHEYNKFTPKCQEIFDSEEKPHVRTIHTGDHMFSGYEITLGPHNTSLSNVWKPKGFNEGGEGKREVDNWVTFFSDEHTAKGYAGNFQPGRGVVHHFVAKQDLNLLCVTLTFQDADEIEDCICRNPQLGYDGTCVTYNVDVHGKIPRGHEIALCNPWNLLDYVESFSSDSSYTGVWGQLRKHKNTSRKSKKRKMYTGPRGGRYYMKKGSKRYVPSH
jgi:hypothetical protein